MSAYVMKKGWIIALGLLLIGVIGAFVWYNNLKKEAASEPGAYNDTLKPRLELSRFDFTDISDDEIKLNMYLLIDNPLPVELKASKIRYTIYIADTPVIEDEYKKGIAIKSGDSSLIELPVVILSKKLSGVLATLERKRIDSTTYKIKTSFDLDVPIMGSRTFTVTTERYLPTYFIPKVTVEDIDLGKFNFKELDVAAKVNVENRNKFPYNITDAYYTVTINGKQIAEGSQPEPILIKAQATTPVIFPVTGQVGKTLSVLPKMVFDKKDTPYEVVFRCKIIDKDGNLSFKNSKFITTIRGTLDDFKKKK